jgi:two-component system nitrogen regulation sensor histidine kinase GlnL
MPGPVVTLTRRGGISPDSESVLNAMASAVVTVDEQGAIRFVNGAAEQFFKGSASHLTGLDLSTLLPPDSPLFSLLDQARHDGTAVSEYGITLESPRIGRHLVNVQAVPMNDQGGGVVLTIHERSIADTIDRRLTHRGAARSVTAMAAMLAHEVKNPLSGIRGAAQLLEENCNAEDRALTRLIRDEADRICALVDRMEVFTDGAIQDRKGINIHRVLDHVRRLAESGFARHVRFTETYDPSLPPVLGIRDELIQVFLNLIKNAAEAAPSQGGEITLATTYRHGVRFAVPGGDSRVHLPLMISVRDNGEGIPEDIRPHLFDAFVTSKPKGSGLGLALVAKIIGDHGGVIEFDSQPRGTVFRVMLPMAAEMDAP